MNTIPKTKKLRLTHPSAQTHCIWPVMDTARRLDLVAGFELSVGHYRRAEYLSHLAAEIREGLR